MIRGLRNAAKDRLSRGDGASEADVPAKEDGFFVDRFEMHGDILLVNGWQYDSAAKANARAIAIYDSAFRKVFQVDVIDMERPDVADHFGTYDAAKCGFRQCIRIETPQELDVVLECASEEGVEQYPIGHVAANREGIKYLTIDAVSDTEVYENDLALGLSEEIEDEADAEVAEDVATETVALPRLEDSPELLAYFGKSAPDCIIAFSHNLGGGAESYLAKKRDQAIAGGKRFAVIRYSQDIGAFICEAKIDGRVAHAVSDDIESILDTIDGVSEVWVNELVSYPNVASALKLIADYSKDRRATLIFLLHDYFAVCQNYNLVGLSGFFCGLPEHDACDECFHFFRSGEFAHSGIREYRGVWADFLAQCDRIEAFSEASKDILLQAYPFLAEKGAVAVVPHEVEPLVAATKQPKPEGSPFVIGVLGALSDAKGRDRVKDVIKLIAQNNINADLRIIGYSPDDDPEIASRQTGLYNRSDLPALIASEGVDILWIPSIWPETFSYTTAEAMQMQMPLAVFDLGAPAERVRNYEKGALIPLNSTPEQTFDILQSLA